MMDYLYLTQAIGEGRAASVIPRWSIDALRAVADGGRELRAVMHPLGFACLPVVRDGDYGICIHAWLPRYRRARLPMSSVHAHSWDLTSYVLFGRVGNDLPLVLDTSERANAGGLLRVLEVRSRGEVDEIVPTSRLVSCAPGESAVIADGDVYTVPAGTFHNSVVAPSAPAATVALGKMVARGADLSLGDVGTPAHKVCRSRCGRAETVELAGSLADRLAAHG